MREWADLDPPRQRTVVSAVLPRIVINPAVRGRNLFDPDRIQPDLAGLTDPAALAGPVGRRGSMVDRCVIHPTAVKESLRRLGTPLTADSRWASDDLATPDRSVCLSSLISADAAGHTTPGF